ARFKPGSRASTRKDAKDKSLLRLFWLLDSSRHIPLNHKRLMATLSPLTFLSGAIHMAQQAVADIGLIGLAVMGENFALNIADHGYKVAVYNRTHEKTKAFIAREKPPGGLVGCE